MELLCERVTKEEQTGQSIETVEIINQHVFVSKGGSFHSDHM